MLILTRKPKETLVIQVPPSNQETIIEIVNQSEWKVSIGVKADIKVHIVRKELWNEPKENQS